MPMNEDPWQLALQVLLSRLFAEAARRHKSPKDWLEEERAALVATFAPDPLHTAYAAALKEADAILRGSLEIVYGAK